MNTSFNTIWSNIIKCENQPFWTKTKKPYTYTIKNDCVIVNSDNRRKLSKISFERALRINNPSPKTIELEGIWGPSYVYGIITDSRIKFE